jgi:hypothetical protein
MVARIRTEEVLFPSSVQRLERTGPYLEPGDRPRIESIARVMI